MRKKIITHPAVLELVYEGEDDGYWCYLKDGFVHTESDCSAIHAWTLAEVMTELQGVEEVAK